MRYIVAPVAAVQSLSDPDVSSKSDSYLYDELAERLKSGPIEFKYLAQVAEEGDPTNDVTKHWPADRKQVELGTIKLDTLEPQPQNYKDQKQIIYDPIPRIDGIEPSDDPLLDMRAAVYIISGKERRAAPEAEANETSAGDVDDAVKKAA